MTQQVERRALGGKQRRGRARRQRHLSRHFLPPLPFDYELVDVLDPALAHRLLDHVQPEDDPGLLLHDPRPRPRLLGNRRLRGHVAGANVLSQRPSHQRAHVMNLIRHPRSLDKGLTSHFVGHMDPKRQSQR